MQTEAFIENMVMVLMDNEFDMDKRETLEDYAKVLTKIFFNVYFTQPEHPLSVVCDELLSKLKECKFEETAKMTAAQRMMLVNGVGAIQKTAANIRSQNNV